MASIFLRFNIAATVFEFFASEADISAFNVKVAARLGCPTLDIAPVLSRVKTSLLAMRAQGNLTSVQWVISVAVFYGGFRIVEIRLVLGNDVRAKRSLQEGHARDFVKLRLGKPFCKRCVTSKTRS